MYPSNIDGMIYDALLYYLRLFISPPRSVDIDGSINGTLLGYLVYLYPMLHLHLPPISTSWSSNNLIAIWYPKKIVGTRLQTVVTEIYLRSEYFTSFLLPQTDVRIHSMTQGHWIHFDLMRQTYWLHSSIMADTLVINTRVFSYCCTSMSPIDSSHVNKTHYWCLSQYPT